MAGSTRSAQSAESVHTWSKTTVNRSSRARPRRTFSWFGIVASGLQLYEKRTVTGGSWRSSRTSPNRFMLITRVAGSGSPIAAARSKLKAPELLST